MNGSLVAAQYLVNHDHSNAAAISSKGSPLAKLWFSGLVIFCLAFRNKGTNVLHSAGVADIDWKRCFLFLHRNSALLAVLLHSVKVKG